MKTSVTSMNGVDERIPIMQELLPKIAENISLIGAYIVLAYALSQARRVTNDVMSNIDQFGEDKKAKLIVSNKAIFNFYLVIAAVIVIVSGSLNLISKDLFIGLLLAILTGLGIKLTADILGKAK